MVDHDMLTEEEARDHPDASVVTRGFGHGEELALEVGDAVQLAAGDQLLLCSDGLSGYVDDPAVEQALRATTDAQEATDRLLALALQAGGEDNVSVQLLAFDARPGAAAPPVAAAPGAVPVPARRAAASSRFPRWLWMVLLMIVAFLLGMMIDEIPLPFGGGEEEEATSTGDEDPTNPPPSADSSDTGDAPQPADTANRPRIRLEIFFSTNEEAATELEKRILEEFPDVDAKRMPMATDDPRPERLEPDVVYYRPEDEEQAEETAKRLNFDFQPLPDGWSPEIGLVISVDVPTKDPDVDDDGEPRDDGEPQDGEPQDNDSDREQSSHPIPPTRGAAEPYPGLWGRR